MTREQKIEAYTKKLDGATNQEIADALGVTIEEVRAAVSPKAKDLKNPQHEELAGICVYPGLAKCIIDNELTAKDIYMVLHPGKAEAEAAATEAGEKKPAIGYTTWVKPRLAGASELRTVDWLALSEAYDVSLDVLMKPAAEEDDDLVN
jgi:hypothetical protein